jgi:nucleotide-binding universal stress UspA family protein
VVPHLAPHAADFPPYPSWAALNPEARERMRAELDRSLEPARAAGISARVEVGEGDVVSEILREARELPADLVALGTHGRGGFERWVLGSVTEKVLRKAPCPVLTAPPPLEGAPSVGPLKRILCPVDFSESSMKALTQAIGLAEESDAELVVLHVLEWLTEVETRPEGVDVPAFRRQLEDDARERLRKAIPQSAREWCRPQEVLLAGKAWRQILCLARERDVELIVMGVHGRNPLDLMLFGSTTHHVIREARCPVLTIRS